MDDAVADSLLVLIHDVLVGVHVARVAVKDLEDCWSISFFNAFLEWSQETRISPH